MKYFLIEAVVKRDLIELVNAHLKEGWTLYGDTQVIKGLNSMRYCQAMVKEEDI
jgi:hypothetical protein